MRFKDIRDDSTTRCENTREVYLVKYGANPLRLY